MFSSSKITFDILESQQKPTLWSRKTRRQHGSGKLRDLWLTFKETLFWVEGFLDFDTAKCFEKSEGFCELIYLSPP